jgi:hypothetical protein
MGLGVRYGFTQSIPGLNPWWDYIPCNRTRPKEDIVHESVSIAGSATVDRVRGPGRDQAKSPHMQAQS